MTQSRRRPGSRLLSAWLIAATIYVLVAGGLSVAPLRHALAEARAQRAAPAPALTTSGPIPEAPDTAPVKIAKAVARQAAIVLGPPALALWFGWDVWFAVTGFFPSRRAQRDD